MARSDRFLNACRRLPVDATPVWLMRQAGRYMHEYRALREKHSILEMIKQPELAAEVTLQPVRVFDVDAAIIFADILTLPEAMGLQLEFLQGEGPLFHNPIRTQADVEKLPTIHPEEALSFTMDAIRMVKQELGSTLPLIGFSGAPFTLACYTIEGGASRHFIHTKTMMYDEPKRWHLLMGKYATAVADYLIAQAKAGADALQLFDSWVGALSPADYQQYVLPYTQQVVECVRQNTMVPIIHFGTETAALLPLIKQTGADVIGVDWRIDLDAAWSLIGGDHAVQGNLDPVVLFSRASTIYHQAERILKQAARRPGHIFNLGHGVLPKTPREHVAALIEYVHNRTMKAS